jgi:hypothetical protein
MRAFCLGHHAAYRCRHSGACCTSNWPIHIEAGPAVVVRTAMADGRLALPTSARTVVEPLRDAGNLPPGAVATLATTPSGACAFYDRTARRCAVHRELGHHALPSACRHFPRRCLIERGAVFVSLSHYCPTVARMALRDEGAGGIVAAPESLVGLVHLEGLDARHVLPPLLRPGMLTDLDGYHAWERAAVRILDAGEAPEAALARVAAMTRDVQAWEPGQVTLSQAVGRAEGDVRGGAVSADARADPDAIRAAFEVARAAVPAALRPDEAPDDLDAADLRWVAATWPRFARPLGRFLAAHAFGNWCAYLGSGLATVVDALDLALAVVRAEAARRCARQGQPLDDEILVKAFRAADLLLVHLADPKALAAGLDRLAPGRSFLTRPRCF